MYMFSDFLILNDAFHYSWCHKRIKFFIFSRALKKYPQKRKQPVFSKELEEVEILLHVFFATHNHNFLWINFVNTILFLYSWNFLNLFSSILMNHFHILLKYKTLSNNPNTHSSVSNQLTYIQLVFPETLALIINIGHNEFNYFTQTSNH